MNKTAINPWPFSVPLLGHSLDNLETVLGQAEMSLTDVVRLTSPPRMSEACSRTSRSSTNDYRATASRRRSSASQASPARS